MAVLLYMFYGAVGGLAWITEPVSKSTVHDLAGKISTVRVSREPRYIAVYPLKMYMVGAA